MLKQKILEDIKIAMKEKNTFKRDTLRFLHSALKQIEIDKRVELNNSEIINVIQKSIKQRNDSILAFKDAKREELAEKEFEEVKILKAYLPEQINDTKLTETINKIIKEINAKSMKDMGKVINEANKLLAGKADNQRISKISKEILKNLQ
jgi:uncharacterized protein YqeY